MNPTPQTMAKHVNKLAESSGCIIIKHHALVRMKQRKITRRHIIECLREGTCVGGWPFQNNKGEWECNMIRKVAGMEVEVALRVNWDENIIVITTY